MYAIFEAGGRQHRAEVLKTVKMSRVNAEKGATVEFDRVLAVFDDEGARIGAPYLDGAKVTGRVVQQDRARKIKVFRYKPKESFKRMLGHRQHYTEVQVTDITA